MGQEIERKFLVKGKAWRVGEGVAYRQGYLNRAIERTVRVRTVGNRGYLTIKGATLGISRLEYEYEIPVEEAEALLNALCEKPLIEKRRYRIAWGELTWEVDEFSGENEGLVLAEIELPCETYEFERPAWLGEEVSGDPRYFNSNLVKNPFRTWEQDGEERRRTNNSRRS